jgi:hypothetical protein
MAVCPLCQQEMLDTVSCNSEPFIIAGKVYEPLPWGQEKRFRPVPATRPAPAQLACDDCGTPPGGIHHHGCDREECPVCHGQAISCSCDDRGEWDHPGPRSRQRCPVHVGRPREHGTGHRPTI